MCLPGSKGLWISSTMCIQLCTYLGNGKKFNYDNHAVPSIGSKSIRQPNVWDETKKAKAIFIGIFLTLGLIS